MDKYSEVLSDFNRIIEIAEFEYNEKSYNSVLECVSIAANIAYSFNLVYTDKKLEELCYSVGKKFCNNTELYSFSKEDDDMHRYKGQVVFYDCFAYDSRGLTQQYIRALKKSEIPFVFILNSNSPLMRSKDIYDELISCEQVKIIEIIKNATPLERLKELISIIEYFLPSKVFLHMTPNDSVGVAAWSNYKCGVRYQINLTDHAFWLGTSCLDYCVEFRNYGRIISRSYRGIDGNKILHLPYYPITKALESFQGFPDIGDNINVKIFSGGTLYKFCGDDGRYFKLMKAVLDKNDNVGLFIAGAGEGGRRLFDKFISENKYQKRVFMLGNRSDISALFHNVDIYIGSYPISGGLMSQLAGMAGVPIVQYTCSSLPINKIESLFPFLGKDVKLTFFHEAEFLQEVQDLIVSHDYREYKSGLLKNTIITPEVFNEKFLELLINPRNRLFSCNVDNDEIDMLKLNEIYFEASNDQGVNYENNFLNVLMLLLRRDFKMFLRVFFHIFLSKSNFKKLYGWFIK